ncbi:hypothetical protein C0081_14380 [Cohaesibacter celericrescens]|uniref:Uncharacterized protein n=1 Tax=Cohaesibacter celericrescens TaxID=2067669 RepID=A0A2N5XNM5_9HYPH|nr:hypothetical protein C0081_14380 [Cohaesibacter celericrescens]
MIACLPDSKLWTVCLRFYQKADRSDGDMGVILLDLQVIKSASAAALCLSEFKTICETNSAERTSDFMSNQTTGLGKRVKNTAN